MALKAAAVDDAVLCPIHGLTRIVEGAAWVTRKGKPIARLGDATSCGARITSGLNWWLINGRPVAHEGDTTDHGGTILPFDPLVVVSEGTPANETAQDLERAGKAGQALVPPCAPLP